MHYDEKRVLQQLADPATRRKAFAEVVQHFGQPLYWKIRHIVLTHEDADDVLQNTFLKAWAKLDEFQQLSKLSTWLYRIAVNESLDLLRRRKKETEMLTDDDSHSVADRLMADTYFDGDETQARLQEAISHLPSVQRTVFTLRYYDNMKYSEMSRLLDTSEGALKASYHIAVGKITEWLKNNS